MRGGPADAYQPKAPAINAKIDDADGNPDSGDNPAGKIGVDDTVQYVEKRACAVSSEACMVLKIGLGQGERAWPGAHLGHDAPQKRENMHRTPAGTAPCPKRAEDHQKEPGRVDRYNQDCQVDHPACTPISG